MRPIDADTLAAKYMEKPPDYYHTSQIVGEITAAPTVDDWIAVKNKLPEDARDVLIYDTNYATTIGCYIASDGSWWSCNGTRWHNVTHWRPLPAHPRKETRND